MNLRNIVRLQALILLVFASNNPGHALTFTVTNEAGEPLPQVMISRIPLVVPEANLADDGYAPNGVTNKTAVTLTRFSNEQGRVFFADSDDAFRFRIRARGYLDAELLEPGSKLVLTKMSDEQNVASYPSNVWLSQLSFDGDIGLKKTFQLNCAFCHQQASSFMRGERTEEQWIAIFERMNGYGARLPDDDHQKIAELLVREYRQLRENPQQVPEPRAWESHLPEIEMTEWPLGDSFSQMHDFLLHPDGNIYIGDNLQDRIYALDPESGDYTVFKVPHDTDARLGGFLGNRFTTFPKLNNYMGVHSFAYSNKDGNIFITPSMQQALLEFNPRSREFTTHKMPEGFYPHTIRIDDKDRVWFTLAVSSQVAMFDREKQEFKFYDLPSRGFKEWLTIKALPFIFWLDPENQPRPSPDREGNGLPMPYGIDVAPDGMVWVARLYANDLAMINPETDEITMLDFPFGGPRRLRADADGNIWIVAFQDSLLVKYDPKSAKYTRYELPVVNEIPYSLNVDKKNGVVWVNGNQSDTLLAFDIASESWKVFPLPKQRFFGRDVEIDEETGAVYVTNSHFPTWQSEGGIPTLLRITPVEQQEESIIESVPRTQ
jgi:streptogramin lyase